LESVCVLFCRLVDNMRNHVDKLREIAGQNHALLKNVQQLLIVQPCAVGPNTFQALVRMLRTMASKCSDLAVALNSARRSCTITTSRVSDFARTIKFLIVGAKECDSAAVEIANRPPQHLQELVYLAGELLPSLPTDGIFEIDSVILRSTSTLSDVPTPHWLWKDNSNQWVAYSNFDSRVLEIAFNTSETDISLQINGNSGPALRYESLRVTLRMIYPAEVSILKSILATLPLAGPIASALACPRGKDLCVVASALQLTHILLNKFPDIYISLFRREGVAHEIEKLSRMKLESPVSLPPVQSSPAVLSAEQDVAASSSRTRGSPKTRTTSEQGAAATAAAPSITKQSAVIAARSRNNTQAAPAGSSSSSSSSSEAGPSSSSATRVIVSPSGGRHRRKASPERLIATFGASLNSSSECCRGIKLADIYKKRKIEKARGNL
uniref:E3 ubiquitin-protein ligase n=1 Tax=Gongylonema pulchrum TaxID=637853 RepID=A0A183DT30_9BILA